jgi:hypothetical protein
MTTQNEQTTKAESEAASALAANDAAAYRCAAVVKRLAAWAACSAARAADDTTADRAAAVAARAAGDVAYAAADASCAYADLDAYAAEVAAQADYLARPGNPFEKSGDKTTIDDFCEYHGACAEGYDWAMSQNVSTMAELWALDMRPAWRVWIATRPGVMADQDLRLFASWAVRRVWHLLADERSRKAVELAERYLAGEATREELTGARLAAMDAYRDACAAADSANSKARVSARAAWASLGDAK